MNWLLAYLLLFGIFILAIKLSSKEGATWQSRLKIWAALFLPVALFMADYPVVYYQHAKDCKNEYGIKVLIEPDKVDSVQLDPQLSFGKPPAEGLLKEFYPRLKTVEVLDSQTKKPLTYSAYTVASTTDDRFKRGWTFNQTALPALSEGMYTISKTSNYDKKLHRHKEEWLLVKDGQVYATLTKFIRLWPKIRYPDAVPAWTCSELGYEQYHNPKKDLTNLILK